MAAFTFKRKWIIIVAVLVMVAAIALAVGVSVATTTAEETRRDETTAANTAEDTGLAEAARAGEAQLAEIAAAEEARRAEISAGDFARLVIGNTVLFGTYDGEALEWQVLAIENGQALLITKDSIAEKPYNDSYEAVTWETCTLRSWLNGDFYDGFTNEQRNQIIETTNQNPDNKDTSAGNPTVDRVFLLSVNEATSYFPDSRSRSASYQGEAYWWWLRSSGSREIDAAHISRNGSVDTVGIRVDHDENGVRPALWLNLKS
jgi:hypothetical protein